MSTVLGGCLYFLELALGLTEDTIPFVFKLQTHSNSYSYKHCSPVCVVGAYEERYVNKQEMINGARMHRIALGCVPRL
jgi:hypothetical protein